MNKRIRIALSKGRVEEEALGLLARAGIVVERNGGNSRRLMLTDREAQYDLLFVKAGDVPAYVRYGAADAGICGLDVLLETKAPVHQPLDLRIGRCQIVVVGTKEAVGRSYNLLSTVRIATKYPRLTSAYFQKRGVPIELVALTGSVELAPVLGLSDRIVDLVQSGRTLRENGLFVLDVIAESTARLIVNRAAYQLHRSRVAALIRGIEEAL